MTFNDAIVLGIVVAAFGVLAWRDVQFARMIPTIMKNTASWHADVANFESNINTLVRGRVSFFNSQIKSALAEAGHTVPESFTQTPVGDAPPNPRTQQQQTMVRTGGRLDEMHEVERELTRTRDVDAEFEPRDAVSFQGEIG